MTKSLPIFLIVFFYLSGCKTPKTVVNQPEPEVVRITSSSVPREFRAAWVATVANINWPSKPGLTVAQQQSEARALLDLLVDHNFNAVIFQARPQADALYPSRLEPWSYYLTGKQGQAPQPFYDPLAFWIEEAHKRGLELHAWLNPYRAHHPSGGIVSDGSLVKQKPELMAYLETGYWWMKPTDPKTQAHTTEVVMDLIGRYDLDGIHFDDYFYPYPSYNNGKDFPDQEDWKAYQATGGNLSKGDWRRSAVDSFIHQLYDKIKAQKPHVKFGISPFGIWRPGYPEGIQGFDQYDQLYADARKWLQKGWVDYWTPQLYWPVNQIPQSFPILLDWWATQNTMDRHLWPGMRIGRPSGADGVDEVINQIMITRGRIKPWAGTVHWSIAPLVNHPDLADELRRGPYRNPALVPPSPWLARSMPGVPVAEHTIVRDSLDIYLQSGDQKPVRRWVLTCQYGDQEEHILLPGMQRQVSLPLFKLKAPYSQRNIPSALPTKASALSPLTGLRVSAVDRVGIESDPVELSIPPFTIDQSAPLATFFAKAKPTSLTGFQTGWQMMIQQDWAPIKGKKWGILTHSDVWLPADRPDYREIAKSYDSRFIGRIDAGQTGLNVTSGEPIIGIEDVRQLMQLDVVIINIQLDGSGWDSNVSGLYQTLRQCGKLNIPVIIVDRPNPLGGERVEGPMIFRSEAEGGPLPVRHGLTTAELSTYWNVVHRLGVPLRTIAMQNWSRSDYIYDLPLPWASSRADLPRLESVINQPGLCLLRFARFDPGYTINRPYLGIPLPKGWEAEQVLSQVPDALKAIADISLIRMGGYGLDQATQVLELLPKKESTYQSSRVAAYVLDMLYGLYPQTFNWFSPGIVPAPGTPGQSAMGMWEAWQKSVIDFKQQRAYYLIYPADS